jgi:hypothetical protein
MLENRYYHAARAAEERRIAIASVSLQARAIHLELAARYEMLVQADGDRLPSGVVELACVTMQDCQALIRRDTPTPASRDDLSRDQEAIAS